MTQVSAIFFQFTAEGDELEGEYMGSRPITWNDGKPGLMHYLKDSDDAVYNFNGTYRLNEDLYRVPVGTRVHITYTGSHATRRGQNPVKTFVVIADGVQGDFLGLGNNPPPEPFIATGQLPQIGGIGQVGGMPSPRMADAPARPQYPQPPLPQPPLPEHGIGVSPYAEQPRPVIAYLPDGTPVFGYTPDGSPLDAYGKLIPQGFTG